MLRDNTRTFVKDKWDFHKIIFRPENNLIKKLETDIFVSRGGGGISIPQRSCNHNITILLHDFIRYKSWDATHGTA